MRPGAIHRPGALLYLRFAPTVAAAALLAVTSATTTLAPLARSGAIVALAVSVLIAVVPKRENVKTHGAIVFAIIAVALTGLTRTGLPYQIGCALFLLVAMVCLRAPLVAARMRAAPGPLAGRARALVVLLVVAAAVAAMFLAGLPPASAYAERQVQRLAGDAVLHDDDRIGFATNIRVGSLNHLLKSERVVMRIDGEAPDLLRGVVLDSYDRRVWSSSRAKTTVTVETSSPQDRTTTRIELSRSALAGRAADPRWFLPADACDIHTPSGRMGIDAHGTAHPEPPNDAREIAFRRASSGTCNATLPAPAPPSAVDLDMATKIRFELTPIALDWARGATSKQDALDAIARHLATFEYSLEDRRESRVDPIVAFLTVHHRGHCELFASAMALLARAVGIPARVVAGYRVDEVNPITGLAVVRDRNAHAWVEAWNGERWVTFDPTPFTELRASTRPSGWNHVTEAVSFAWDRTLGFFARLGLLGTGVVFAIAAVVLLVIRRLMQRGRSAQRGLTATSRPLPSFDTLASALENAGFARSTSEPLERFAQRVGRGGEPWSTDVADALERYAELRYGGIGEERTIAERLDALARKVAQSGARAWAIRDP